MAQFDIPDEKVNGEITNVTQAIQYVKQKMRSSKKWKKVNKGAGIVVATGIAFGVGLLTGLVTMTLRTCTPGVVTARRYLHRLAHHLDRKQVAASMDTPVSHFNSLAKYAAASFKKSRSCSTLVS